MNRFMARWIRKVVKNDIDASILYLIFFRKSVDRHFDKRLYLRRSDETGLYYKVDERADD